MNIYAEWLVANTALKNAKAEELRLRKIICGDLLSDKLEGSLTTRTDDMVITTTARLTRTLDAAVLDTVWDDMTDDEKACITYKPSLVLASYKKLELDGGALMEAVTVKPALASLKILPKDLA